MSYQWPIVPLSKGQLLDINPDDILADGHFRMCNIYKGGGGYDKFPEIAKGLWGSSDYNRQFIVQLYGCNLDCPYCYVAREGVWGSTVKYTSEQLVEIFNKTNGNVFHLMGGAPALKMNYWPGLLRELEAIGKEGWIFHSDLMLTEREYTKESLRAITHDNALYAVNVKGVTQESFLRNTRKNLDFHRFWKNLGLLVESYVQCYFTFTGLPPDEISSFWDMFAVSFGPEIYEVYMETSYFIPIIEYEAMAHVDDVSWGVQSND